MGADRISESQAEECLSDWVVRASPDGLWVLDDEGRTRFANEQMARFLGVTHGAIAGFSAYAALDASDGEALRQHLCALRAGTHDGDDLECALRRPDGGQVWVQVTSTAMSDRFGARRGWVHRVRENSALRRQLELFESREQEFTEAQQSARIGAWAWDFVQGTVIWSAELFRVLGVDPMTFDPSYDAFLERVHHEDRELVSAGFEEALAGDGPFTFDFRFVSADGATTWVRNRGVVTRDATSSVVRVRGTCQDITESKDIENALTFLSVMGGAANEARTLADVLKAADAIIRPYAQWPAVVISVPKSPESTGLFHIDVEWETVSDELRQAARDLATRSATERRVLEEVGPTGTVLIAGVVVAGGRLACVLVSDTRRATCPSPFERNVFVQMLTMLQYVAEREWAATELAAARDQALSASRAKSEFLATMGHEIRTPLSGVIGLSELLGTTDLTPHQRRLTSGVDQAGRTLLALVNDILDLSKIEAGRLDLEEVDFDPRTIIEQSAALVADLARDKSLELVVSSAGNVPELVRGDPVRFGQIITNLAANAVKFTASGEVVVRATGATTPSGTEVRVEVSDTGVGIGPEVEARLFETFSQADSSTTREYGGTGLGLAISKRIVTAMHGEIGVKSELGFGSTFWFNVVMGRPLQEAPGGDVSREKAVAGLRVLIVDHNETNRFILSEKLTSWQVSATAVASAYEALVELESANRGGAPYDIALLDHMMPGADGEQLARIIRAEARNDGTRIALLSSATEPSSQFLADAGIDSFLNKPVLPRQLLQLVATLGGRLDGGEGLPVPAPNSVEVCTRGRILVVEDNPINQLVAEGVLERLGYSVLVASDGAAGVAAFAAELDSFDAVLMDGQMPVMDGYDASKAIRAMPWNRPRIPIIAMTAASEAEERERCLAAGMDDFLLKPVDVELLEKTLDRWIVARTVLPIEVPAPPAATAAAAPTEPTLADVPAGKSPASPVSSPVSSPVKSPVNCPVNSSGPSSREPKTPVGVLDRGRLLDLLESGAADLALLFRILDRFGSRADDATTEMTGAVQAADFPELSRLAHGLRGSAANVGLVQLAKLCETIELGAREGELPPAGALFEVEDEVAKGVAELDSFARDMVKDAAAAGGSLRRGAPQPSRS